MSGPLRRLPDAAAGLALEAAMFACSEARIALWCAAAPALVCPARDRDRPGMADAAARAAARGWPLAFRPTGGGAVPQGPGILNLALAFTAGAGFTIADGYRLLTATIRDGLGPRPCGRNIGCLTAGATAGSFCDGAWNLSHGGRKVAGTAQRWRPLATARTRILAHAVILVDGEIGPAVMAVDTLHRDLGLPPLRPDAHTTLAAALAPRALDRARLAISLHHVAVPRLRRLHAEAGVRPAA